MLRAAVLQLTVGTPSNDDLGAIAQECLPTVVVVLKVNADDLHRTLMTAYDNEYEGRQIRGVPFMVIGAATLGALLNEPKVDPEKSKEALGLVVPAGR